MLLLHPITGLLASALFSVRIVAHMSDKTYLPPSTKQVELPNPYLVAKHQSAEGAFNQTYHFNVTQAATGEFEIIILNVFSSFETANARSTAISTRETDTYDIEGRGVQDWVCTATVNCVRAAKSAYTITAIQALSAGLIVRDWFNDGGNWRQFYTGQIANIVLTFPNYYITSRLQKTTANNDDTCGLDKNEAYKQGYQDAAADFMAKFAVDIAKGHAEGRTYTRQARRVVQLGQYAKGKGVINAISASSNKEDGKSQPLLC